jgi:hypothetical protein
LHADGVDRHAALIKLTQHGMRHRKLIDALPYVEVLYGRSRGTEVALARQREVVR